MRILLPLLTLLPLTQAAQAQELSLSLGDSCRPQIRVSWGRPAPRIRPIHRCSSSCWRTTQERVWVAGATRWIEEPAQYQWVRSECGWQRVCVRPATRRCVQDPGRWTWRTRRVRSCH